MKNPESGIVFKTLIRLVRIMPGKFRLRGAISFFLLFLNSGLDLFGLGAVIPLIAIVLTDNAIQKNEILSSIFEFSGLESERDFILLLALCAFLVLVFKNMISLWIHHFQSAYSYSLQRYFSSRLFRAYYDKGFDYFNSTSSSRINRYVQSIPSVFAASVLIPLMTVINELVMLSVIATVLIIYDATIVGLLFIIVGPAFIGFYQLTKKKAEEIAEEKDKLTPPLLRNIMEAIYGFVDAKVTNTEHFFFRRHEALQNQLMKYQTLSQVLKIAPNKIMETSMFLGVTAIIIYGVLTYPDRSDLVTLLSVFAVSAYRVLPSVNRIMTGVMSLNAYKYTLNMIERECPKQEEIEQKIITELLPFSHSISLKNVQFKFDDSDNKPVLKNLNLEIKKGEVVGIIGTSGSGKTTLMNVLLGFLIPQSGSIKVDEQILDNKNIVEWRNRIGYVQQNVFLIDGSLRENVAFGRDHDQIDDEKVLEALERASLGEFVKNLKDGIDSQVGERGSKLSGGQLQRVGIARALYNGSDVLFFDEATSALDNETENDVTAAIYNLSQQNLTILIIAHRYSTLKFCDRIIKMEQGTISEEVTYDMLEKVN